MKQLLRVAPLALALAISGTAMARGVDGILKMSPGFSSIVIDGQTFSPGRYNQDNGGANGGYWRLKNLDTSQSAELKIHWGEHNGDMRNYELTEQMETDNLKIVAMSGDIETYENESTGFESCDVVMGDRHFLGRMLVQYQTITTARRLAIKFYSANPVMEGASTLEAVFLGNVPGTQYTTTTAFYPSGLNGCIYLREYDRGYDWDRWHYEHGWNRGEYREYHGEYVAIRNPGDRVNPTPPGHGNLPRNPLVNRGRENPPMPVNPDRRTGPTPPAPVPLGRRTPPAPVAPVNPGRATPQPPAGGGLGHAPTNGELPGRPRPPAPKENPVGSGKKPPVGEKQGPASKKS